MLLLLFSLGLSKFLVVLLVSDLDWNRQDDDDESEKLGLKLDDEIVEVVVLATTGATVIEAEMLLENKFGVVVLVENLGISDDFDMSFLPLIVTGLFTVMDGTDGLNALKPLNPENTLGLLSIVTSVLTGVVVIALNPENG